MRTFKFLLLIIPAVAMVPIGVLGFRSCLDEHHGYTVIQKMHKAPFVEEHSGRTVNATWAVVIKRDDGMPPIILQCSQESFDAHEVGDPVDVVTVPIGEYNARMLRLARDAEKGWRPVMHAPK